MFIRQRLRNLMYIAGIWEENVILARRCPHCNTQVGTLATSCWNCKLPLDNRYSQLKEVDYEEREEAKNIGKSMIVLLLTITVLVIILALTIAFGGRLYLLILLIYVGVIAFGFLFRKSRKAEKVMRLNRMSPWGDGPIPGLRGRILINIFEAQKLREWEVEKSELVNDTILIAFGSILWILLIILPHRQGPLFYWWSYFSPVIELLAIYILYPIFLGIIIMIFYNDIKIYKSRQFKL